MSKLDDVLNQVKKEDLEETEYEYLSIVYRESDGKILIGNGKMNETVKETRRPGTKKWKKVRLLQNFKLPEVMTHEECTKYKKEKLDDEESRLNGALELIKERNQDLLDEN